MRSARSLRLVSMLAISLAVAGCGGRSLRNFDLLGSRDEQPLAPRDAGPAGFGDIPYASWSDYEPAYRFYPGDEIEVSLPTAPELSKTVIVQPDGRREVTRRTIADRATQFWRATLPLEARTLAALGRDSQGPLATRAVHHIQFSGGPQNLGDYMASAALVATGDETLFGREALLIDQLFPMTIRDLASLVWTDDVIVPALNDVPGIRLFSGSPRIRIVTLAPGPENDLKTQAEAQKARATNEIQMEYLRTSSDPANIHAMCEDYRAGATIDMTHDEADMKKKIACPLLVLWGQKGAMHDLYDVMAIWRERATKVSGRSLPAGHNLQEDVPEMVLAEIQGLLKTT